MAREFDNLARCDPPCPRAGWKPRFITGGLPRAVLLACVFAACDTRKDIARIHVFPDVVEVGTRSVLAITFDGEFFRETGPSRFAGDYMVLFTGELRQAVWEADGSRRDSEIPEVSVVESRSMKVTLALDAQWPVGDCWVAIEGGEPGTAEWRGTGYVLVPCVRGP